jgi:deoxyribodipyrimidine photo-lyase
VQSTFVYWFRRDLRCHDNAALQRCIGEAVATGGRVAPLFVVDPTLLASAGANRVWWTLATLRTLRASGVPVAVRIGKPVDVVATFAREVGADKVWAAEDFTPYARARDQKTAVALCADGRKLVLDDGPYVVAPGTVRKGDGTPFKVFTPFSRAWDAHARGVAPAITVDPPDVDWADVAPGEPPAEPTPTATSLPEPGERAAGRALSTFVRDHLRTYDSERNRPDRDVTSRLSPYLKVGALHPRTVLAAVDGSPDATSDGARVFRSEIAWREFYADVLFHRPDSRRNDLNTSMQAMAYDAGLNADAKFQAWCDGRTGYPFVDAGMRQLRAEGWMHNRVRMAAASFLVKDLHLDWRRGAQHFLDHLLDGDIASNQHGWQWTAGTGTDAAPYFRIFNPISQGKRFDPDGAYVRRYVPELADVADRFIHEPWLAQTPPAKQPGMFEAAQTDYPQPVVDHAIERNEALRRYSEARADT